MDINYLGQNSFKIKTKTATVLINPVSQKNEADIILFSKKNDTTNIEKVSGYKKVIANAGEYEISGVSMMSFKDGENLVHMIEADGIRIIHSGTITKEIKSDVIDEIGATDVLMVGVSDEFNTVSKIDPYFILPMGFSNTDELEKFNKSQGYVVEILPKFVIKKEDITEDLNTKIIQLEAKN